MASTFAVTRNHLIFGLCLPFAILLGYLLADVTDPAGRIVIFIIIGVLVVPLLMRWYHVALVFTWNMAAQPALPGSPSLWAVMAVLGLGFAVLNRSMNPENRFAQVPALTMPLLVLSLVVLITAWATGGVGLRIFGSASMGGKGYFYIFAAIAGFFALSSRTIPTSQATLYLALFFLPGLTAVISRLAYWVGPGAHFLFYVFRPDFEIDLTAPGQDTEFGATRFGGMTIAAFSAICWMLARFGVRGLFDFSKAWRLLAFLGLVTGGFLGGFRSFTILTLLTVGICFYLEKLWRTRIMLSVALLTVLTGAFLVGFADQLPFSIQRSLSFLPLKLDPMVKISSQTSSEWRVDMWKSVIDQVPQYLFKGKGYNISADDMYMTQYSSLQGFYSSWETAALAGDYHSGPLSLLIPFGIYGFIAFSWLIVAGTRFLHRMYRESPPELKQINSFLLAVFLARGIFFFTVFGAVSHDLFHLTGLLGLSVALNANRPAPASEEPEPSPQI
jgi:O-antigen ligase